MGKIEKFVWGGGRREGGGGGSRGGGITKIRGLG